MKNSIFDLGYQIKYLNNRSRYAELSLPGKLPLLEFHKVKVKSLNWCLTKEHKWFFCEATLNDNVLNGLLPEDWQTMKYRGFDTMQEIRKWLGE